MKIIDLRLIYLLLRRCVKLNEDYEISCDCSKKLMNRNSKEITNG